MIGLLLTITIITIINDYTLTMSFFSFFVQALVQILCNTWGASKEHAAKGVDSLRGELAVVRPGVWGRIFGGILQRFSMDCVWILYGIDGDFMGIFYGIDRDFMGVFMELIGMLWGFLWGFMRVLFQDWWCFDGGF